MKRPKPVSNLRVPAQKRSTGFLRGLAVGVALGAITTGAFFTWSTWDLSMLEPIEEIVNETSTEVSEITFTFINRLPARPCKPSTTHMWCRNRLRRRTTG